MGLRRNLLILCSAALVATACGDGGDSVSVVELEPVVDPGPTVIDDAADASAGNAAAAGNAGNAGLVAAFQTTAEAQAYRAEMALGVDMRLGDGEFAMVFAADPTQPMMLIDVDAEGEQHVRIDMGSMMNSILAADGMSGAEIEETLGSMTMEMWLSGTVLTLDIRGFGELLNSSTGGAGALFPAEVFTVDATRLGDSVGANDLASAMAGQAAPDPAALADVLSELLGDADAADVTGDGFAGTIGFLDYARAFGQDPESLLGSGMGAMLDGADGQDFVGALLDVFETMEVDVSGIIADGAVDTLRFDMDLSAIWDELPTIMAAAGESMSPADLAEFREMTENATFDMTVLMDYDLDPSVEVTVPEGDFPDATDRWIELFGAVTG